MQLTQTQLDIIKSMVRNRFDATDLSGINYVLNEDYVKDLIAIAKHYGFNDLAVEMANDFTNAKYDK